MTLTALTCEEFLADFEQNAARWMTFLAAHPKALAVPCDIAKSKSIGDLVWHIYAAEVRLSQRLLGEPVNAFAEGPDASLEAIQSLIDEGGENLHRFLASATPASLEEQLEFTARTGSGWRASRRKVFVHAMLHAVRHQAQASTILRQHGFKLDWPQDFLGSNAIP